MTNMGNAPVFLFLYFYLYLASLPSAFAAQNFVVPWSTKKFGPDGPWQAVTITVGGNDSSLVLGRQNVTELSVLPGGEWSSMTFAASSCKAYPDSLCGSGGTWDPDPYQARQQYISVKAGWVNNSTGVNVQNAQITVLGLTIAGKTVFNATLASASSGNVTYPNGKVGGVPLGYLALGAENRKQFFSLTDKVGSGINASLFPGQLFENGDIPSYSYGLHIGSAAFNYPGSLVFGGYNKGRVIGPVTSFLDQNAVDLIDISIGVATGGSPFNFTTKEKLLSTGQTAVSPDPLSPYLSLPRQTCDNIASNLPVTFDQDMGYYLWNTNDPNYAKIVSSPAYLGFTFPPSPGTKDNVVIKVPFALLNLTLTSPITDTPKQYFPCLPYKYNPRLGRAFLQAAFLGRNWGTKTSWLAQAPGPGVARQGLGDQNTDIPEGATMIDGNSDASLFADSWKRQWTVLDSQGGSTGGGSQNGNSATDGGLSTGAKAGIGVGAALGAIALLAALLFFLRKRSAKNKAPQPYAPEANSHPVSYHQNEKPPTDHYAHQGYQGYQDQQGYQDWNHQGPVAELPHSPAQPVELGDAAVRNPQH